MFIAEEFNISLPSVINQEMGDTMAPPPPPPPAPSSHKGRRIHQHRRPHHREGFGFTDKDVAAAAHQLMQLSDDSDEDKRRSGKGGSSSGVDREVTSARIEEIFGTGRGDRGREVLRQPRNKRYRSISEIYAVTEPIESRRTSSHNVIR